MQNLSLDNVRNYVQGNAKYLIGLPKHEQEQVAFRKWLCQDCARSTNCLHCGCKIPQMFYSPKKVDKLGKWGEFMTLAQWDSLKKNVNKYAEYFSKQENVLPVSTGSVEVSTGEGGGLT